MSNPIDTKSRHITQSGGNIFADLGFAPEKAAGLLVKSGEEIAQTVAMKKQLMAEIAGWMKENGHRQAMAAQLLHVSRPRVSDVVNQKTEKFTLDSLVNMMGFIGRKVTLVVN
ncbi:XRE family transcriptional regulator [Erwiniaceae bacterium BAC15a-03b]|uniref:XRE family transcriptional regulator n=1 Tax=Winslowiella arboricola TaxID=2978220 RepID=A0A9J6PT76_9GAMM|nr:XRE family transcriptional regulator [Winslowiella arboricola]MCU5774946.1 XRE family transcriptional regulator [Winslowiella arboricola]MCU5779902.1 XRE family transcriptional regulator [Winslowiella arboricola]